VRHKSTILTTLLLSWIVATAVAQQDDFPERKNSISWTVLPALDRTVSFTYARKLNSSHELTINPRVRIAGNGDWGNIFILAPIPDPPWYYDSYSLRTGLRILLKRAVGYEPQLQFSYEPQLQLGYGTFFNKVLVTSDVEGDSYDESLRLDRKYYSAGIINSFSWIRDYNRVRTKWFIGIGFHLRNFQEMQLVRYVGSRTDTSFDPHEENYFKLRTTIHGGAEIGFRY